MALSSDSIRSKYEGPASRYVDIDGRRLHYRIEGTGPTLVLLHGVLASLHTWDGWVEQLKSSYRIIRLDLPGFGLSDHFVDHAHYTPDFTIALLDKMRAAVFDAETFYLAGSSLGGLFSWYYATKYPARVEKLILLDPIAYPQRLPPIISFVGLPGIGELSRYISPRFMVEANMRQVYGDAGLLQPHVVDRYHELMKHGENRFAMVRTFRKFRQMARDELLSKEIAKVRAPTLLMWGEKDRWVPPALIENWKRDLKQVEVKIYQGAGHLPMEERPHETARDAHAFLSRVSSAQAHR